MTKSRGPKTEPSTVLYWPSYRFDNNSYMSFRLVQISVSLNDLESRNGLYFCIISPNSCTMSS